MEEEEFQNEENEYHRDEEELKDEEDLTPNQNKVVTVRLCIGQRCRLKNSSKHFTPTAPKQETDQKSVRVAESLSQS